MKELGGGRREEGRERVSEGASSKGSADKITSGKRGEKEKGKKELKSWQLLAGREIKVLQQGKLSSDKLMDWKVLRRLVPLMENQAPMGPSGSSITRLFALDHPNFHVNIATNVKLNWF